MLAGPPSQPYSQPASCFLAAPLGCRLFPLLALTACAPPSFPPTRLAVHMPATRRFIKQEAEEKAAEIGVAAEEEFNITRLQLLEAEKARVRREFERRESTIDVKKKVR